MISVIGFGFGLKLHVQVGLKDLIFIERVDADIAGATGPERLVGAAAVAVAKVEDDRVADGISGLDHHAFHVHAAIEEVGINQVWVERILLGVLPESLELPVVFGFQLPDSRAELPGVALVLCLRMSGLAGGIVG